MRRAAFATLSVILILAGLVAGQQSAPEGKVQVNGQKLFVLTSGRENLSAAERAAANSHRLHLIANSSPVHLETRVEKTEDGWQVLIGNEPIVTVTDRDAGPLGTATEQLAKAWASVIQQTMVPTARASGWRLLLRQVILATLILVIAVVILILLRRGRRFLGHRLEDQRGKIPAVRFRGCS